MVRWVFLHQTARGGEVRALWDTPHVRGVFQEIPSEWFRWKMALSVPWRDSRSHINVCEARARGLDVRTRARQAKLHCQKYLYLLEGKDIVQAPGT